MKEILTLLDEWLKEKEGEHFEFKEAQKDYFFEKLVKYCVALANEGGGRIILGVTDQQPRQIVGTEAYPNLERTKVGLMERSPLRIEAVEIPHPQGRVLVFHIPSRPLGYLIAYKGAYWMRRGQELVPMTADMLQRIFAETGPDFSAEICPKASLADLDPEAVENFRQRWSRKAENAALGHLSMEQLLIDAELLVEGELTFAALVLFGRHRALGKFLGQAEVIFEYRSQEASIPYQQRVEYRLGLFSFMASRKVNPGLISLDLTITR